MKTNDMTFQTKKGFSLVEMLIYLGLLTLVFLIIIATILSFTSSYRTLAALRSLDHSATGALERITRDIRNATSVDTVNSTFLSNPGVLVLTTTQGGVSTTTRLYVETNVLKVNVNNVLVGPLTTSDVAVTNLVYTLSTSTYSRAIKIDMTLQATNGPVVQTKTYHSTIVLK
jgi:Tfp pilus assembly protein PilW